MDLWTRTWNDGFVVVDDEAEMALASGFKKGTRHVRTWQIGMRSLERLGFILVQPKTTRAFGYVRIVHPHYVAERLHKQGLVSKDWWDLFQDRLREIGAGAIKSQQLDKEFARVRTSSNP